MRILKQTRTLAIAAGVTCAILIGLFFNLPEKVYADKTRFFEIQSIDTMKYSRDMARDGLGEDVDAQIELHVKSIAETGATHVAIATPYDDEFIPFLTKWVKAARKHKLNVWFRGNFAGWEGWFDYPRMTREEHVSKLQTFISSNKDLFEDGDIFSACPECENGGPGDPRHTGDVEGFQNFMIEEYNLMQDMFQDINKDVRFNLFSMNGDVAELVMDMPTTEAVGGVVTIDHYVLNPEKLVSDIEKIAKQSGGKVVLGEFGAPIPDIHGTMTQRAQADWLENALRLLSESQHVLGVNYWTHAGSSTEIWDQDLNPRLGVEVIRSYYMPFSLEGTVKDSIGRKMSNVSVSFDGRTAYTDNDGSFEILSPRNSVTLTLTKPTFVTQTSTIDLHSVSSIEVELLSEQPSLIEKIVRFIKNHF